jgi:hypothetical protein
MKSAACLTKWKESNHERHSNFTDDHRTSGLGVGPFAVAIFDRRPWYGCRTAISAPQFGRYEVRGSQRVDATDRFLSAINVDTNANGNDRPSVRDVAEMKSLKRLDLHGSGEPGFVTGEKFSINALRQLSALPKLRTLWLTNIRSSGSYLGLADLTQLRELSLMMADIRTDELVVLEEALPNTIITCVSGGGLRRPSVKRGQKTES